MKIIKKNAKKIKNKQIRFSNLSKSNQYYKCKNHIRKK